MSTPQAAGASPGYYQHGAGLLPANAGTFAGWIASNQHLKPGNLMPAFQGFSGEELRELASYLESLK